MNAQEKMKVYFAGAIRGGREYAELYQVIISYIEQFATVLTKHVGNLSLRPLEKKQGNASRIYRQDVELLESCDLVIAECTQPSLSVGYELAYAEKLGKPCYVFYQKSGKRLSAMILGNPYFTVSRYNTISELFWELDKIFSRAR